MKKFLYLLLMLPLFVMTSCSDDDDFPQVDITISMQPASFDSNVLYVVKGQPFTVNSLSVTSLDGKAATLGQVGYYWNNVLFAVSNVSPYSVVLNTSNLPLGKNLLQIRTNIFQVDKTITAAWMSYNVMLVDSADEIPEGAPALGEVHDTMRCTPTGN